MNQFHSMLGTALLAVLVAASRVPGQLRVLTDRAACVPGRTLVLPIAFDDGADPRAPVRVWLADGRSVIAQVYRLEATAIAGPTSPIEAWMGRPARWHADHVDRVDPRLFDASVWVLEVRTPMDASGTTLRVGDDLLRIAWLTDGSSIEQRNSDGAPGWRAALDDVADLARLSATQRGDPMLRWRADLLAEARVDGAESIEPADDEMIAALAAQQNSLWRVGLDRLWEQDETLAGPLVRALWATVRFAGSTRVPVWTSDQTRLDELLWTLMDQRLDDRTRDRRVRSWIGDEPQAVAWVIDDAGRSPTVRIGVANLTDEPMLAWATPRFENAPPDPTRVPPGGAIELDAMSHEAAAMAGPAGAWELRLGPLSVERQIVAGRVGLVPPGLTIGPLLADWTLDDWTHSVVAPRQDRSRAAIARLVWIADDLSASPDERQGVVIHREAAQRGHLALYIECAWSDAGEGDDIVRVWIGPTGAPRAVLRVSRAGFMSNELARLSPTPLVIVQEEGRWSALVPIPVGVLAGDGTLRLGIERIDPAGRRSAWPRRMLPWQPEPGRIRIDPSSWDGLADPDHG